LMVSITTAPFKDDPPECREASIFLLAGAK
jgi:hypothetical protein